MKRTEQVGDSSYLSYPHAAEILKCVLDKYPVSTTDVSAMLGLPYQVTQKTLFLLREAGKINAQRVTDPNSTRWEKIYAPAGVDPAQKKRSARSFRYAKYELVQDEILEYLKKIQRPTTHREIAKQLRMYIKLVARSVNTLIQLGKVKPANENATHGTNNYRVVIATYGGPDVEVEKLRKWVASRAEKFKVFRNCVKNKSVSLTTPFVLERNGKKYAFLPRLVFRKVIGPGVLINDVTAQLQKRGLILETKSGKICISVAVPPADKMSTSWWSDRKYGLGRQNQPSKFGVKSITGYGILIEDERQ